MQKKTMWQAKMTFVVFASFMFLFVFDSFVATQTKYKPGDRVECDATGSGKYWDKGTVVEFKANDMYNGNKPTSGYFYRVRIDKDAGNTDGKLCKTMNLRPLTGDTEAGNTADENKTAKQTENEIVGKVTVDENNTLSADRPLLKCPIEQKPVKKNASPDVKLFENLIRCLWEKPAVKGTDGALTVDVTAMKIGVPRPWNELRDLNNDGGSGTTVYPVEAAYTWKTFYRTRTVIKKSIQIFNCYVNKQNEWRCGAGIKIKDGENISMPRQ
ncbi:MAG: hypothetical protein M3209_11520 [Acidobacteriota bacterium]|nr:hypothetical protein [Acidobacteriota bacterium]